MGFMRYAHYPQGLVHNLLESCGQNDLDCGLIKLKS